MMNEWLEWFGAWGELIKTKFRYAVVLIITYSVMMPLVYFHEFLRIIDGAVFKVTLSVIWSMEIYTGTKLTTKVLTVRKKNGG